VRSEYESGTLFSDPPELESSDTHGRTQINDTLYFVDHDGARVVFQRYEPLYRISISDAVSVRFVAVNIRLGGLATQEEIASAFGHSVATQRRWETRYQKQGIKGLEKGKSTGRPRRVSETCDSLLRAWFSQGVSNAEMARRLGVSPAAIGRALARMGLQRRGQRTAELPWTDDPSERATISGPDDECQSSLQQHEEPVSEGVNGETSQEQHGSGELEPESIVVRPKGVASAGQSPEFALPPTDNNDPDAVRTERLEDALVRLATTTILML